MTISHWGPFRWTDWDARKFRITRNEVTKLIEQHRPPDHELHQRTGAFGAECLYCATCERMVWTWDDTESDDVHQWDRR